MRNIFTCFLLGILVWFLHQGGSSVSEPTAYVGLLMVISVLLARLTGHWGLSVPAGALVAGFLLRTTGLVPGSALEGVQPFAQLGTAWVGLYLGAFLSPARLFRKRLLPAAALIAAGAALTTCVVMLAVFGLPADVALGLGILASLAAPSFLPQEREGLSVSVAVTGIGLLCWGVFRLSQGPFSFPFSLQQTVLGLVCWGGGIEMVYRLAGNARTEPGRYVIFAALSSLILLASHSLQVSVLPLAAISGLALSTRARRNRRFLKPLGDLSEPLVLLVLAHFAARLGPAGVPQLSALHWTFLFTYAAAMVLGKILGGVLATRLTGSPLKHWSHALPQGVLAAVLLSSWLPDPFAGQETPGSDAVAAGLVLLCGAVVHILLGPAQKLAQRIEMRRARGTLGGSVRPLREASD